MGIFDVFGEILKNVAKKNQEDEQVKTADPVVFEEVKKKLEECEEDVPTGRSRSDIYKDYAEKVREAQRENEASQEVETADESVFGDLMKELERMQNEESSGAANTGPVGGTDEAVFVPPVFTSPVSNNPVQHREPEFKQEPQEPLINLGNQAVTNSPGSLALRAEPNMGAATSNFRIPDKTLLKILQYSDNSITLDGKRSRFVLVDFNGNQGWILESYLNFN